MIEHPDGGFMSGMHRAIDSAVLRVKLPRWPVYAWGDESVKGWLSGFSESTSQEIDEIRLSYYPPNEAQQLLVQTVRRGAPATDLDGMLKWISKRDDDAYPDQDDISNLSSAGKAHAANLTSEIVYLSNGGTRQATLSRFQGNYAWSFETPQVLVFIACRGLNLGTVRLNHLSSLEPYKRRRLEVVSRYIEEFGGGA